MAKFAILAAVFGVLLVAATAARTGRDCWDQVRRAQMLSHCQDFLDEVSETGRCYGDERRGSGRGGMRGSWHLDQCCDQLSELDQECMCEGLREIVRQQVQQSPRSTRGQSTQEIVECAKELPQICRMGRSCYQIRVPY